LASAGPGTHQPLRGTPSAAWKETSSYGSWNDAGVSPSFSLSVIWNLRPVKIDASQYGAQPKTKRASAAKRTRRMRFIHLIVRGSPGMLRGTAEGGVRGPGAGSSGH